MRTTSTRCDKCLRYLRIGLTLLFSHIGLCALVVGYTIMGAFTFEALEAKHEKMKRIEIIQERKKIVESLWDITTSFPLLQDTNWTYHAHMKIREFELKVVKAVRKEGFDGQENHSLQWSFSGALLYSVIVITTIGYGNIAPKTSSGKVVTILYAIIGIPLLLLCLSNIGDVMAHSFKFIYWKVCCYLCVKPKKRRKTRSTYRQARYTPANEGTVELRKTTPDTPKADDISSSSYYTAPSTNSSSNPNSPINKTHFDYSDACKLAVITNKYVIQGEEILHHANYNIPAEVKDSKCWNQAIIPDSVVNVDFDENSTDDSEQEEITVPILLCLALVIGYICGGAVLFSWWEDWGFLDSSYFCFVTLTTIGFGDLVPGTAVVGDDTQLALGLCSLYLMFGMALLAMSFNLVQEEVTKSVRCIGKRIGILSDDDDDDDEN
ncbi:potassium channel subfamily K member 18-like [Centruroides vittatus]|uniref:potassium channel subfamily K member 18-like n=1 Tax=Centruroides vittatus TaxID=120091 RepID=UPI00350E93BB